MKTLRYISVLLGLVLLTSFSQAWADEPYLNLFGGWAAHNQDSMEDSKTRPTGVAYGAGIGRRVNFYEFELNISKGKYTADIEHDGQKNTLINDQLQATLALNFYLVRFFYARLGYALTSFEQKTKTPVSGASGEGLKEEYGLKKDKIDGLVLGGGYVITPNGTINLYLQYEYYMLPQLKASQHLMSAGLRWYL